MALLEFINIKKNFKNKQILTNISFQIEEGEICGIIGNSGGGKTTLLKILMGMTWQDGGDIWFNDKNIAQDSNYLKKNTGFATQESTLLDELTIKENSFYFGKLYGMKNLDIKNNFERLISLLNLKGFEETEIRRLSGGMKKRANILVSLIHEPKLLILDEPTVGLDPVLRSNLWKYIHEINKTGTTILITSHLLEEIEENCNNIAILNSGEIVSIGTMEEYKENFGKNKDLNEIFRQITSQQ